MEQNITVFTQHNFQFSYNCSDMTRFSSFFMLAFDDDDDDDTRNDECNHEWVIWCPMEMFLFSVCISLAPNDDQRYHQRTLMFSVQWMESFCGNFPKFPSIHLTIAVRYERVKVFRRHGVDYRRKFSHERLHNSIRIASRNRNFLTFSQGLIIRLASLSTWRDFHLRALAMLSFSPSALD